jgi:hypothetical protein
MNEHIKSLEEQCYTTIHGGKGGSYFDRDYVEFDKEKFAELIIRECASISNAVDDTWTGQGIASAQAFMLHFGVKE